MEEVVEQVKGKMLDIAMGIKQFIQPSDPKQKTKVTGEEARLIIRCLYMKNKLLEGDEAERVESAINDYMKLKSSVGGWRGKQSTEILSGKSKEGETEEGMTVEDFLEANSSGSDGD